MLDDAAGRVVVVVVPFVTPFTVVHLVTVVVTVLSLFFVVFGAGFFAAPVLFFAVLGVFFVPMFRFSFLITDAALTFSSFSAAARSSPT